ncbi:MAG TPA: DUF1003 domain-containing protein [Candidatus Baltobacteraceae bacterium]|nr:DUF1003 domain-containing protein [Candidatus Baltobacteraceae bacterium]
MTGVPSGPEGRPIEQAVRVLAEIRAEDIREAPTSQVGIERFIHFIGRPWLAYAVATFLVVWIASDVISARVGGHAFDPARFPWLQLVVTLFSTVMTILILITENHQGLIAERRAQVTLQIALVSEQKIAKVIELLEHLRRDDPHVPNRRDDDATRMAEATDLRVALSDMDQAQENA